MSSLKVLEHQVPILQKLEQDRTKGKVLVVIPSGAGKTHIAAFDSKNANAKKILYIAHRREILRQAANTFYQVHGVGWDFIGFIDTKKKEFHKPLVFATIQTLSKKDNFDKINNIQWDYVVVDEFHHIGAPTYQRLLESIQTSFLLGLTATDYRLDGKDVGQYVDGNISTRLELEEGIKKGILVPFHYNGLHDNIDYSDIRWQDHKYRESDLNKKLLIDERDNQIVEEFKKYIGAGHSTIAFCVSIKHCYRMIDKFTAAGVSCRMITYETPIVERDKNVNDFQNKKFDVLLVRDVFNEGVDFPRVEGILFLRPTWSKNVFYQQLGRGLRRYEGKTHVTVLDFIGNYNHAYDKAEWLQHAIKSDNPITQDKPVYSYNISYVYFDNRVIDIFERQRKLSKNLGLDVQSVINAYYELKQKLGKQPRLIDFNKDTVDFSRTVIVTRFGTYANFLKEIEESNERCFFCDIAIIFPRLKFCSELCQRRFNTHRLSKIDLEKMLNLIKCDTCFKKFAKLDKYYKITPRTLNNKKRHFCSRKCHDRYERKRLAARRLVYHK